MVLRVMYKNNKYDMVKASRLDELIDSGKIVKFHRSDGWATIGLTRLRETDGIYNGPDRRRPVSEELQQ